MTTQSLPHTDLLRSAIREEYADVASCPWKGFHFNVGRVSATRFGYADDRIDPLPDQLIESFAGVGNPFFWGDLQPGEKVVDLGSGAGLDAILAAKMVGSLGSVIGIDMTSAMLEKARKNADAMGLANVQFCEGYLEDLPVESEWADAVISNGVFNLCPDKRKAFSEAFRVLKPGGRMQISDIVVSTAVPDEAKGDIDLWTG